MRIITARFASFLFLAFCVCFLALGCGDDGGDSGGDNGVQITPQPGSYSGTVHFIWRDTPFTDDANFNFTVDDQGNVSGTITIPLEISFPGGGVWIERSFIITGTLTDKNIQGSLTETGGTCGSVGVGSFEGKYTSNTSATGTLTASARANAISNCNLFNNGPDPATWETSLY